MSGLGNIITMAAVLSAAAAFAGPTVLTHSHAHAQNSDGPIHVWVRYGDLDIGQTDGAKELLQRIKTASVTACGGAPDVRLLRETAAFSRCRKTAVEEAVAQVNSPILTAMAADQVRPVRVANR